MAEHGKTVIPLNDVCEKYLGLNPQTANYHASTHQLPFNTFHQSTTYGSYRRPGTIY
ncbi:pyocin activator PrtN family protein [Zooshikella ganghwensis]|uniref:pyocin activator PrtN family protein n=1 Tax=Zooshikella ganghwensis TaxID=202772 RepID=UPI00197D6605